MPKIVRTLLGKNVKQGKGRALSAICGSMALIGLLSVAGATGVVGSEVASGGNAYVGGNNGIRVENAAANEQTTKTLRPQPSTVYGGCCGGTGEIPICWC
jgi:hypothetical protein